MIRLYVIRHGETEFNLQGRIQGQSDSPLTRLGVRQAEAVAERLAGESFDAIYSSDLGRAMQTAEIVAARHGMPVRPTPLLRERDFGIVQGLTREEIEERFPSAKHEWRRTPSGTAPPDAETHDQVVERCGQFVAEITEAHEEGSRVLAICHGGALSGLVLAALRLPVSTYRQFHFSNASLSILDMDQVSSIRLLNDTCHLATVDVTEVDADAAS